MQKFFALSVFIVAPLLLRGQNWASFGGGNEGANTSPHPGSLNVSAPLWQINNAFSTDQGGNMYSFGDRFVTTRFQFSAPGQAKVECRNLSTGALLWTTPLFVPGSKVHAMAFNEDAVYVHDYSENNERLYALNPETGEVKWSYPSYTFAPLDGLIFDCNRNPIFNTSRAEFNQNTALLRSVDKNTGATRWILQEEVDTRPNRVKAAHGSKLYQITGTALTPKKLSAVDLESGQTLYYSNVLPGGALQNFSPFIGPDGTIYVIRDAGSLSAFEDTGSGFSLKWQFIPVNISPFTIPAVETTGDVVMVDDGRIKRISKINGLLLAESALTNLEPFSVLVSCADSLIILNDRNGKYHCFSYDLQQIKWTIDVGAGNFYSLPNFSKQGIMLVAGSGTTISAFGHNVPKPPVADFSASKYFITEGDSIAFENVSSYQPASLEWTFEGGNPTTSSAQNPIVNYNQPGTYPVRLIAQNALGSDTLVKNCYITVNQATSVHEAISRQGEIICYPNPAGASVFVDVKNTIPGRKLKILNAQGKVVYEANPEQFPHRISLDGLAHGLYQICYGNVVHPKGKFLIRH